MSKRIKILHYIHGFNFGGIESRMLEILDEIDKDEYQLDILVLTDIKIRKEEKNKQNGGRIYQTHSLKMKTLATHYKYNKNLLDKGKYDVIHSHSPKSFLLLRYAKKIGIN